MSDDSATTKWSDFIPELYYDLIARVIPGAMLVAIYIFPGGSYEFGSFTIGMFYLFFSYFIGYIADVSGRLTIRIFFVWVFEDNLKEHSKSDIKDNSDRSTPCFFVKKFKEVKYKKNRDILEVVSVLGIEQQSVVKKLLAESTLLRVSAILCIPCLIWLPAFDLPANFVICCNKNISLRIYIISFLILLLVFHINSQWLANERAESLLRVHNSLK